ncbi:SH3-binding, glutamic acid-rich protein-domain-containing protein [Suillus paluster]|uniref:SH3-binding, glutamic acid-rich protein-domain-containing protein n=1 Tax=Suillus paluster TaxID=48578 RepID=UPI001B86AFC6|nr:SH3-binding, glutamic acid-rich protein-domain-containing protein [Suillus paluster]KAG1749849.1 SH3-binding, glutamic acid-rich protein-domain-containing protein [Suillus paluster]
MPSPPIQVFLTTIASQVVVRKRQEYILRILQTKKIPYTSYDLASDEDAKRLWRRKAPPNKQQLPGILVGGKFIGDFDAFEEAVETECLATFLRLNETWDTAVDEDRPAPEVKPVGVPGAVPIAQMTPEHHKPRFFPRDPDTPLKPVNRRKGDFDVSTELEGYGLQGVRVTDEDLRLLVEELGLEGDDAEEMVKSLGGDGNGKDVPKGGGGVDEKVKEATKSKDATKASTTKEDDK